MSTWWRGRVTVMAGLALMALAGSGRAEVMVQRFIGEIVNTTHDVTAPIRLELVVEGERLTGHVEVEPPLSAGRWPLEGRRTGAWCEFVVKQSPTTQTLFRVVWGTDGQLRGTYVFGGEGEWVQYGRLAAKRAEEATR